MGGFSPVHWLILLLVVLVLFGAGRVADLGKGLGEGIKNFKKGIKDEGEGEEKPKAKAAADDDEEVEVVVKTKPKQLPAATPKKKKVIEVEVDEGADEAEVRRAIAAKKKAMAEEAEDETA